MVRSFFIVFYSNAHFSDRDDFACQDFAMVKVHEDLIFLSRSCDDYYFGQDSTLKFRMACTHHGLWCVRSATANVDPTTRLAVRSRCQYAIPCLKATLWDRDSEYLHFVPTEAFRHCLVWTTITTEVHFPQHVYFACRKRRPIGCVQRDNRAPSEGFDRAW